MSDVRFERALRQGPPDERTYQPRLRASSFPDRAHRQRPGSYPAGLVGSTLRLIVSLIVVLAAGGVLWVGQQSLVPVLVTPAASAPVPPSTSPSHAASPDLLSKVLASGALDLAIRPDYPQAAIAGLEGFDVDVATELARRLGVSPHPVQVPVNDMVSGGGTDHWDLALPSAVLTADQSTRFESSAAYYYWPVYLVVSKESTAASPADLAGARVCAVAGSSGEAWLAGRLDAVVEAALAAPATPIVRTEATDWACLDALTRGDVDALVSATLTDSDLAARPSLRTLGAPLYIEPRTILAARTGPDPSALLTAIDDALGAMRSEGLLADLSRNRFGGRDLTTPPNP